MVKTWGVTFYWTTLCQGHFVVTRDKKIFTTPSFMEMRIEIYRTDARNDAFR